MAITKIRGNTQIIDGSILDAQIDASAAIVESKLSLDFSTSGLNTAITTHTGNASNPHSVTKSQVLSGNLIVNADVDNSAAIAYSKLALTGAILNADLAGSIALSKLAEAVIQADGGQAFTATQSMGGFKLTSLGTPAADSDAANKSYVDSIASGLDIKDSVRVVTTAVLPAVTAAGTGIGKTLTADAVGVLTIDGVATVLGDRILVKDQVTGSDNGIYEVTTEGTAGVAFILTRATDADEDAEVTAGMFTFVTEGTANSDTGWVLSTNDPITVDTTALTFTQFSQAGVIQAGAGMTKTGNTLDVVATDASVLVAANSLKVQLDTAATISLGGAGIQVADGTAGQILIGKGAGVDTAFTAISGDISMDSSGVTAITTGAIVNADINASAAIAYSKLNLTGLIVNADINASAAIAFSKLASLTSGNLIVGSAGSVATSVAMSGDATLANDGTLTLAANVLKAADIVTREVPTGNIDGSNTSFALANTPTAGTEHVYLNGILQNVGGSNDYTISGGTITYNTAPVTGDVLVVSYNK